MSEPVEAVPDHATLLRQFSEVHHHDQLRLIAAMLDIYREGMKPGGRVLDLVCDGAAEMQANNAKRRTPRRRTSA